MSAFIKSMSKRSKRSVRDSDVVRFARVNRPLVPAGDMITKRLTYSNVLSSNGAAAIPVTTYTTASVQSIPAAEWASFAARYQQFRVRAISLTLMPYNNYNTASAGYMVCLAIGDYLGSSVPGSNTQLISDENTVFRIADKVIVHTVTWARNPNAKLWNPTSAALPTANNYAIAVASLNAINSSTGYFTYVVEWDVEFRGAQ
jgi:hypothetical protein